MNVFILAAILGVLVGLVIIAFTWLFQEASRDTNKKIVTTLKTGGFLAIMVGGKFRHLIIDVVVDGKRKVYDPEKDEIINEEDAGHIKKSWRDENFFGVYPVGVINAEVFSYPLNWEKVVDKAVIKRIDPNVRETKYQYTHGFVVEGAETKDRRRVNFVIQFILRAKKPGVMLFLSNQQYVAITKGKISALLSDYARVRRYNVILGTKTEDAGSEINQKVVGDHSNPPEESEFNKQLIKDAGVYIDEIDILDIVPDTTPEEKALEQKKYAAQQKLEAARIEKKTTIVNAEAAAEKARIEGVGEGAGITARNAAILVPGKEILGVEIEKARAVRDSKVLALGGNAMLQIPATTTHPTT